MSDSDYIPALESPKSSGADPSEAAAGKSASRAAAPPADGAADGADEPTVDNAPRIRFVSDKTRGMIRALAEAGKKGEVQLDEDLVPMEAGATTEPPAAAGRTAEGAPTSAAGRDPAAAPAALPAPTAAPAGQSAPAYDMERIAVQQAKLAAESRAKEIDAREAALVEREKALAAQAPDRRALIERPAATIAAMIKDHFALGTDDEVSNAIADIVSELSLEAKLIKELPPEVKDRIESRKAMRSVRAYQADLKRQEEQAVKEREARAKAEAEERERQTQAEREKRAIQTVTELVNSADSRKAYPFLHAQDDAAPADFVVAVIREQLARGSKADWQAAAQLADNHFRSKAERLSPLLAPAPAQPATVAAPKPASNPGGAPGPAPKTLTTAPTAPPAPEPDDDRQDEDRYDRRHRALRTLFKKHSGRLGASG